MLDCSRYRWFLLLLLVITLVACERQTRESTSAPSGASSSPSSVQSGAVLREQPAWDVHIQAAPGSWVGANDELTVYFTHTVQDEVASPKTVDGVIAVEPPLDIETAFVDDKTLRIKPLTPLARDVDYRFILFPNNLLSVPKNLAPYEFVVRAYRQDLGLQIDGLRSTDTDNQYTITGQVFLNDADSQAAVEQVVKAQQGERALPIRWQQQAPTHFQFTISDIQRLAGATTVNISWDGTPIAVNKVGQQAVDVPSLNTFDAVSATVSAGGDQFVTVNFSEPLDRRQPLASLVTLNGTAPRSVRVDGNAIQVFPVSPLTGTVELIVNPGVRSAQQALLDTTFTRELTFLQQNPGVRFKDNSYILPDNERIVVPIEAVNVDSLRISAYRMYEDNLGQFLQRQSLSVNYLDRSTSEPLWRKTYRLPEIPKDNWQQFDLDLTDYLQQFKNDLLALEIEIDRSHSIVDCGERPMVTDTPVVDNAWPTAVDASVPNWVNQYYRSSGRYEWRDRNNPCKDQFYTNYQNKTRDFRYVHASNIALVAKMAVDHSMAVVVTDINTATPQADVDIVAYNFQHQPVARARTDSNGMATFTPDAAPYYLLARTKTDVGFLRLLRNEALSTNVFDVGGTSAGSGLQGYFYGERGVWRPGDDIYLTFIARDASGQLPPDYPLTLDFFDPKGTKVNTLTNAEPINGFYTFKLNTDESAPTGNWRAVIRYGGEYFNKVIPVETIVPNRLKIAMNFPADELSGKAGSRFGVELFSQWLNGASATDLRADVEMNTRPMRTRIDGYDAYVFDDPARQLNAQKVKVFDGLLDGDGKAKLQLAPEVHDAPGKVRLNFTTRVFEKSGNFSTQYMSVPYLPYDELVGMNIPKGNGWNNAISRDETHEIAFVTLDGKGKPVADVDLDLEVYRIDWRWWWDRSTDNLSSYINSNYRNRLRDVNLKTDANGRAGWELQGQDYDWGRYLVRVCDKHSNHCAGEVVYLGWSYNQQSNPSGETQLIIATDKDRYTVGDTASLTIPQLTAVTDTNDNASAKPKVLLTLESGTGIVSQRWIEHDIENGRYDIPITATMAPNIYAHVTVIQPYLNKDNDSPVRLYGIVPLLVDNPNSRLQPVIETDDKVRPQTTMHIGVSEANGRAMTYTLAVVDEGLLGITNFRTPDPHAALYQRESLGVLTWDMYELLSNANAAQLQRLISIGGSDQADDDEGRQRQRRFPPVAKFMGPFTLAANETAQHEVELPEYMGAVRVMVVAGDDSVSARQSQSSGPQNETAAYGRAEQSVTVTQPLTLLATLPRVLGPNEDVSLPIDVFVSDDSINDVDISVQANENIEVTGDELSLHFDKAGDQIATVALKSADAIGTASITVTAQAGSESYSQTINVPVRAANVPQLVSQTAVVEPGATATLSLTPNGMLNTNEAYVEISRVPQINLQERLDYLIGYPHGCLEQTTSKLFPQLFLPDLTSLSDQQKQEVEFNINAGIRRLGQFQNSDGDFNYWPNGGYSNLWANNYAGHFLIEAKRKGYFVPAPLYEGWLNAQKRRAQSNTSSGYESADAYTLYTLALANSADFNAMNRLKEKLALQLQRSSTNNPYQNYLARWLLAAAYARAGAVDAARELMAAQDNVPQGYEWAGYSYGSYLRDTALLTLVYGELNQNAEAWEKALDVARQLSENRWYSTQSLAWSLVALSRYFVDNNADQPQALSWRINRGSSNNQEEWSNLSLVSPIMKQDLDNPTSAPIDVDVKNESDKPFYVLLANSGIPSNAEEVASSFGVDMHIEYLDLNGQAIDVSNLSQGQDFVAKVTVSSLNRSYRLENLALDMIMPSGWQISNERLQGEAMPDGIEYQDLRDDRLHSYFTLGNYYYYHRNNPSQVVVTATINASFAGRFYLPGWQVQSMYDNKIHANSVGRWITVTSR